MKNDSPIVLICGSKKPARGINTPSAARELLRVIDSGIQKTGKKTVWIDLRSITLPFFDGRTHEEYSSRDLQAVVKQISSALVIVVSIPAYWGGASGVIKNMLDLLGGPKYKNQKEQKILPLNKKLIAMLVVGDDDSSAHAAAVQMRHVLTSLGGWVLPRQLVIGNPRNIKDVSTLFSQLEEFGSYIGNQKNLREI